MGERDAIADSDQGRSFRAFWDFLLSSRRQEELSRPARPGAGPARGGRARTPMPAPAACITTGWRRASTPSARWRSSRSSCAASSTTSAWLENRRIMDLLHGIESKALALRAAPPPRQRSMDIALPGAAIELALERPLHTPPTRPAIAELRIEAGDEDVDPHALFEQVTVSTRRVSPATSATPCRTAPRSRSPHWSPRQPLEQGLAELSAPTCSSAATPSPPPSTRPRPSRSNGRPAPPTAAPSPAGRACRG